MRQQAVPHRRPYRRRYRWHVAPVRARQHLPLFVAREERGVRVAALPAGAGDGRYGRRGRSAELHRHVDPDRFCSTGTERRHPTALAGLGEDKRTVFTLKIFRRRATRRSPRSPVSPCRKIEDGPAPSARGNAATDRSVPGECPMTCERVLPHIEAYFDGELAADERLQVEAHIAAAPLVRPPSRRSRARCGSTDGTSATSAAATSCGPASSLASSRSPPSEPFRGRSAGGFGGADEVVHLRSARTARRGVCRCRPRDRGRPRRDAPGSAEAGGSTHHGSRDEGRPNPRAGVSSDRPSRCRRISRRGLHSGATPRVQEQKTIDPETLAASDKGRTSEAGVPEESDRDAPEGRRSLGRRIRIRRSCRSRSTTSTATSCNGAESHGP